MPDGSKVTQQLRLRAVRRGDGRPVAARRLPDENDWSNGNQNSLSNPQL